jgi:hypothetical protein
LKPWKARQGKSITQGGGFREQIPIQESVWNIELPGYLEADTVAHCGGSTMGEYINTLTMVDIATTWTETRAVFGKGSTPIVHAIEDIEQQLPFDILGYDCDNGTEVLNSHVLRYFRDERIARGQTPVHVTRSREYKKNDNAHVEQKNWMTARDALGFRRMENPDIVPVANDLYKNDYRFFKNYFTPCFKLKEKLKVGSRYKRIYDDPKTPLERVLESDYIAEEQKQQLKQEQQSLDPFTLSKNIERKILRVKALAKVSFEEWQLLPDSQKLLTFLFQRGKAHNECCSSHADV